MQWSQLRKQLRDRLAPSVATNIISSNTCIVCDARWSASRRRPCLEPHTMLRCSIPLEKSRFFACLLLSLMFKRRSFTESALRSASS